MLVLLRFELPDDPEVYAEYLVETQLSEEKLYMYAKQIGMDSSSYDDIIRELEKRGLLREVKYTRYFIYV